MKSTKWMRTGVLAVALLAVVGVMAVLACGPSAAPSQQSSGGGVSESVSVPATEAPFVLPQSGNGDGGPVDPTGEPTATPTPTVPFAGDVRVGPNLVGYYADAVEENVARQARGEDREFPVLPVFVKATPEGKSDVAQFLSDNGGVGVFVDPDPSSGSIALDMNIGLIPDLLDVDDFVRVDLDLQLVVQRGRVFGQRMESSRRVSRDLDNQYFAVEAEATRTASRGDAAVEFPVVRVVIELQWADHVDYMVEFLKANGGKNIKLTRDPDASLDRGTIEVDVSLKLTNEFHYMARYGVERVERARQGAEPSSSVPGDGNSGRAVPRVVPSPVPTEPLAVEVMQADQWHRSGFTGAGVEVAVIDADFRAFRTRILPRLSGPVKFLCYTTDSNGDPVVREGEISVATSAQGGTPAGYFDACETTSSVSSRPHGTDVFAALLEIAPDVTVYLSNADKKRDKVQVLKWLTAGVEDNVIGPAQYRVLENDDFDVKVINHSIDELWNGLGDGSSPFDGFTDRSLLNIARDSADAGVLWVNAAGNAGGATLFSTTPLFSRGQDRFLVFGPARTCNRFVAGSSGGHIIQARWKGSWPGESTDIDLSLHAGDGSSGVPLTSAVLGMPITQSGADGTGVGGVAHYPHETLRVRTGALIPGRDYCVKVQLKSGVRPDWLQLQIFDGSTIPVRDDILEFNTDSGSLTSPGESANDGMLSVGFTDRLGMNVDGLSSRGPAPEPVGRKALDLVAPGYRPGGQGTGASFASPRVAGLAALVIQALGDREEFDEPEEIAQYMKLHGSTRTDCVNDWGCGFAILPPLDPPDNVTLASTPNACLENTPNNVKLTFDLIENGNPDLPVSYFVEARKDVGTDDESLVLAGYSLANIEFNRRVGLPLEDRHDVRLPGGETYVAEVRTCLPGLDGEPICGMASELSNELPVVRELCKPVHFDFIGAYGTLTLRWDDQPDAADYEVRRLEEVDDDLVPVPNSEVVVTDQHLVISGVLGGVFHNFQLRARGPSGESAWSDTVSGIAGYTLPYVLPLRSFREHPDRNRLGQYDAVFAWLVGGDAALHELQVREVGTTPWTALSSDPAVAGEGPRVIFTRVRYNHANFGNSDMFGAVTGLIPGTEYELRARGVNGERMTPWTTTETFTTTGCRPVEDTVRPAVPVDFGVLANAAEPSSRVVLGWKAPTEGCLHEVRIMDGGFDTWVRLPQQPSGWDSEYSVIYPRNGLAFITGLIPGTEYRFAVRAVKERDSSEQLDHSPWSEVVSLTTPGTRPAGAPGSAGAPALKAPPMDLMTVVDGTTVTLSWTAAMNPNYTSQRLLRRVAGVSPVVWTEIPLAVDVTTYTDAGLTSGVTYRYRVRAYKDSGNYGEEKGGFADAVIP